mgnify:CR=1 FL=1
MLSLWLYRRRLSIFRSMARRFLWDFQFDKMLQIIIEEQGRAYYEDNYYTRRAQFDEALSSPAANEAFGIPHK